MISPSLSQGSLTGMKIRRSPTDGCEAPMTPGLQYLVPP